MADMPSATLNCARPILTAIGAVFLLSIAGMADTLPSSPPGTTTHQAPDSPNNWTKEAQYTVDTTGRVDFTESVEDWFVSTPGNMCFWYLAPPNCDTYQTDCEDIATPTQWYWTSWEDTAVMNCDVVLDGYWINPCSVKISTEVIESPAAAFDWPETNRLEARVFNSGNTRVAVQITPNDAPTASDSWTWVPADEWTTVWINQSSDMPMGDITHTKIHLASDDKTFEGTISVDWIAGLKVPIPEPPVLRMPATGDTITTNPPTFTWDSVAEASAYRLQYATEDSFDEGTTVTTRLNDSTYLPTDEFAEGTYYWRVQSINAHEFASEYTATDSFFITAANQAPQFDSIPDTAWIAEGTTLTFQVFASDPDNGSVSLLATDLPADAAFTDSGNGIATFEWSPGFGTAETYPVVITVTDGELSTEDTVIISVAGIESITPDHGSPGETITLSVTAINTKFGQADFTLVQFDGDDITFADTADVISPTELSIEITIPDTIAPGEYDVIVLELPTPGKTVIAPEAFEVINGSNLALSADTLSFQATENGANPAPQDLIITSDNEPLDYAADLTGLDWIAFDPASGTTPDSVTVTVDIDSLAAGIYHATVPISSATALNSPRLVVIALTIDPDSIALLVDSTSLSFTATQDGANPAPKSFRVSTDGAPVDFTIAEPGSPWLALDPTAGTTDTSVLVSLDITGLAAGDYTDTLSISSTDPLVTNSPQQIVINLTVAQPANNIVLSPVSLNFTATEGGANPDSQTFNITSSAGGFDFLAIESANWINVTPQTGSTPTTATVAIDNTALPTGTYTDSITVASDNADNSPQFVYVTLTVTEDTTPLITEVTPSLGSQGETIDIVINGSYTSFGQGDQTVVRFENPTTSFSTTGVATGTTRVTATVDIPTDAAIGVYDLTVEEIGLGTVTAPGAFEVLPGSDLIVDPAVLSFSADLTGSDPAPKSFTVTSNTANPLSFSLAGFNTNWISANPVAGTTPSEVTVSIDTEQLGPGTFEDTIIVSSPSALNSPQQITIRLAIGSTLDCQATADPPIGPTPLPVTFTATVNGGLPPYKFYWDLGNGYSDTSETASYTYYLPRVYNAMLFVTDSQGTTCSTSVQVTAQPNPVLSLSTSALDYGQDLTSANLIIDNSGTGTLHWEATDYPSWVTITPSSGSVSDIPLSALVTVDRQSLNPGNYRDSLAIASETDTAYVTLLLEVIHTEDMIEIIPPALDLGVASSVEQFTIRSLATQPITWQVQSRPDWIPLVTPTSGVLHPDQDIALLVYVDRERKLAGKYSGSVRIQTDPGRSMAASIDMTVPLGIINSGTYGVAVTDTPCFTFNSVVDDAQVADYIRFAGSTEQLQWDRYVHGDSITEVCFYPATAQPFGQLQQIRISASDSLTDVNGIGFSPLNPGPIFVTGAIVWPGDANADGVVDEHDILPLGIYFGSSGPARETTDMSWGPHLALAHSDIGRWQPYHAVYADTDGSGSIDSSDVCALSNNWNAQSNDGPNSPTGPIVNGTGNLGQLDSSMLQTLYDAACNCPETDGREQLKEILATELENALGALPTTPQLYQNYPNPFNPNTTIGFYLPTSAHVSLKVYNVLGQDVRTLYEGTSPAGTRTVDWNATDRAGRPVSSGTYYYVLEVNHNTRLTGSMVLIK